MSGACALPERAHWFAVWTRSQCEPKVEEELGRRRVAVFLPRVRVASRRTDRRVVLDRPLFPGYLFVRFAPSRDTYLSIASAEGVVRVLGEGWDSLHPIPDAQVEAVQRLVSAGERPVALPWLRTGERVRIVAGPLAGVEGVLQARRGSRGTFVVSVDLLRRSVGVEVDAGVVAPA